MSEGEKVYVILCFVKITLHLLYQCSLLLHFLNTLYEPLPLVFFLSLRLLPHCLLSFLIFLNEPDLLTDFLHPFLDLTLRFLFNLTQVM